MLHIEEVNLVIIWDFFFFFNLLRNFQANWKRRPTLLSVFGADEKESLVQNCYFSLWLTGVDKSITSNASLQ